MDDIPGIEAVQQAQVRIRDHVRRTPIVTSSALDASTGAVVLMKCEQLQNGGAFKARGACNAVFSLPDTAVARGVATHSSGNHGAALALAARGRGIAAHVVVPSNAAAPKRAAMLAYGATLHACEPNQAAREAGLRALVDRTGAAVVHPYDDWAVICGQGTAALELLADAPDLEVILVPVGGGGLVSGTAIAAHGINSAIRVVGVRPVSAPDTVADGLRAKTGERNALVIGTHVHDIVTVSETAIIEAMRWFWERTKMLVEASSATVIAALLDDALRPAGRRIGVILSGGNVDLDQLPWRLKDDA